MFKGALKGEMQRGYAGPLFSSLTPAGTVESHEESVHSLLRTSKIGVFTGVFRRVV